MAKLQSGEVGLLRKRKSCKVAEYIRYRATSSPRYLATTPPRHLATTLLENPMRVFQVTLPHFYQIDSQDQSLLLGQLVSLFAGPLDHCRLLTFVLPASLQRLEQERRRLAMSINDEWARRGLLEEVRLIGDWARRGQMRKTRHFLIDFNDTMTADNLAHWRVDAVPGQGQNQPYGLAAGQADVGYPQLPIPGDYAEYHDHMVPVLRKNGRLQADNSRYRYGILASHQLVRTWDWRHPLAEMIVAADGPMIICLDCRKIHPERVDQAANFWQGMRHNNGQDRGASLAYQEAETALNSRDEAVHHVRLLFMLLDKKSDQLRQRLDNLRRTSSRYMKLDPLHGYQAAAARMFGPTARPSGLPAAHFNTLSRLPAIAAGMWGVGREQQTQGYYVGLSIDEVAPHVYYLQWQGNDAFHGLILGRTGRGKTVAAQALAWRLAEQGVQVILLEPQGHSRRLLALARGKNVSYSQLSYEQSRLNILDVVYENPTDQYDHVLVLLGLLLDPLGGNPRHFTNAEIAALRRALQLTYSHYEWHDELLADHSLTPTLSTLCHKLYQVAAEASSEPTPRFAQAAQAARVLAEEIESLYVAGDYAAVFNAPTNIDLSLQEQIVLFDFSRVPERRRSLFYYAVLANINYRIRRQPRRRAIFIDEVNYMCQEPSLMTFLAHLVKTVRTYGAAVVMIDQDLETFVGNEGANDERYVAGQLILHNLAWVMAFGLAQAATQAVDYWFKDQILPSQVTFLIQAGSDERFGKGKALILVNGKADKVFWQLRPLEMTYLLGS